MENDDESLMAKYSITCAFEKTYSYKNYTYRKLKDALAFAKVDSNQGVSDLQTPVSDNSKKPG